MKNFLWSGWFALHRIASDVAHCDFDDDGINLIDTLQWSRLVYSIPQKLGIDPQGSGMPHCSHVLGKFMYRQICEKAKAVQRNINDRISTKDLFEQIISTNSVAKTLVLLRESAPQNEKFDQASTISIINAAQRELTRNRRGASHNKKICEIVRGLTLLGLGYRGWSKTNLCKFCYRIAELNKKYCTQHLVDHEITLKNFNPLNQDVRHKLGARTSAALSDMPDWKAYRNSIFLGADSNFGAYLFSPVKSVDWRKIVIANNHQIIIKNNAKKDLQTLCSTINQSKYVKALFNNIIYNEISADKLIQQCRIRLDPLDYRRSLLYWASKIKIAERWLYTENFLAGKSRGVNYVNRDMLNKAVELANIGYPKSKIALELGIKRNTFSNWIRRYPQLREALSHGTCPN